MVPPPLDSKVAEVLDYLRVAKFKLDSPEEEAGRALLDLLRQTDSSEALEFEAFHIAASRLKLTSPKAILLERRCLNKLLVKLNKSDIKKEKIVNYFLYLLKKHGKNGSQDIQDHSKDGNPGSKVFKTYTCSAGISYTAANNVERSDSDDVPLDSCQAAVPPKEFCCPISSKLMYEPVVIASGQTYERVYIEKWFHEGHDTCPKTQRKLADLSMVPNSCMKDLITNWCKKHGINISEPHTEFSTAEYGFWEASHGYSISSLNDVSAALLERSIGHYFLQNDNGNSFNLSNASYCSDSSHVNVTEISKINDDFLFTWSDDYQRYQSFSSFDHETYLRFFGRLLELPNNIQGKAIENVKVILESDEDLSHSMLVNGFAEALISVMKNALAMANVQAMKIGSKLFLSLLSMNRVDISFFIEDALKLFISFLNSGLTMEALVLLRKLVQHPSYRPKTAASDVVTSTIKILDSEDVELLELSLRTLLDLSADRDMKSYILSSECVTKLGSLLTDRKLVDLCLKLIRNLSDREEGTQLIAKSNSCLSSIAEVLDIGTTEEKEEAVAILHSICSMSYENCLLVLDEGVIPALVDISVNGNGKGMENSLRLLHLLREVRRSDQFINSYIR